MSIPNFIAAPQVGIELPYGCANGKVREPLKSLGLILWRPRMSLQDFHEHNKHQWTPTVGSRCFGALRRFFITQMSSTPLYCITPGSLVFSLHPHSSWSLQ